MSGDERLLTVEEVAVRLRVSGRTVRRMLTSGAMLGFRVHKGAWRVRRADVEAYVAQAMRATSTRAESTHDAVRAAAARAVGGSKPANHDRAPGTARLVDLDAMLGPPEQS